MPVAHTIRVRGKPKTFHVPAPPSPVPYATLLLTLVRRVRDKYLARIPMTRGDDTAMPVRGPVRRPVYNLVRPSARRGVSEYNIHATVDAMVDPEQLGPLLDHLGRNVVSHADREWDTLLRDGAELFGGFRPGVREIALRNIAPNAGEFIDRFRTRNLGLIRSMVEGQVGDLETILRDNDGLNGRDLTALIQDRCGVTERHAALLARDQTLKMNANVSQLRAENAGATSYVWITSNDERVRGRPGGRWAKSTSDHWDLQGKTFDYDSAPVTNPETGVMNAPGEDFQCLPGTAPVMLGPRIVRAFRRRYSGELTALVTDSGESIETTPNHPILTRTGWKPAHLVEVGDDVFRAIGHGCDRLNGDVQYGHATIQQVYEALAKFGVSHRARGVASQFHGDGSHEEIDVVNAESSLPLNIEPAREKDAREILLAMADANLAGGLAGSRDCLAVLYAMGLPACRIVRGFGQVLAIRWGGVSQAQEHRLRPAADGDPGSGKVGGNRGSRHVVQFRQREDTAPPLEALNDISDGDLFRVVCRAIGPFVDESPSADELAEVVRVASDRSRDLGESSPAFEGRARIVEKRVGVFDGHVYNLQTVSGWYSSGIIVRNCRCTAAPDLSHLFGDDAKPEAPEDRPIDPRSGAPGLDAEASDDAPEPTFAEQWHH